MMEGCLIVSSAGIKPRQYQNMPIVVYYNIVGILIITAGGGFLGEWILSKERLIQQDRN